MIGNAARVEPLTGPPAQVARLRPLPPKVPCGFVAPEFVTCIAVYSADSEAVP